MTAKKAPLPPQNAVTEFAARFSEMTEFSQTGYEEAVYTLLDGLARWRDKGVISAGEYDTIIGRAADVMADFHLDVESLAGSEQWYRNSVVHQMGQGMLQALRNMREDLTLDKLYREALSGLAIGQRAAEHLHAEKPVRPASWGHRAKFGELKPGARPANRWLA